ncbi:DUF6950 family protein [Natronospira bacteriovora]|uniref:DUF6950 domain-containing protein n=1 Tax=Natronospira bacteriovora TaxID=3069753 RepID=A0ABU0W5L5_9GAMM|nr:hypothetical protein [Natronospira sp. AB-CW4]MDQ2069311.1 hypothetical protein [Natronospira sp. AB-CW4]
MIRRSNWERRLNAYLRSVQCRPHTYGEHDCTLFVAGAIQAMTGEDLAADVRGEYASQEEAFALIDELGGSLEAICRDRLGEPVAPLQARRGDVVIGPWADQGGDTLGVVLGARVATVCNRGQTRQMLGQARLAWRVG